METYLNLKMFEGGVIFSLHFLNSSNLDETDVHIYYFRQ